MWRRVASWLSCWTNTASELRYHPSSVRGLAASVVLVSACGRIGFDAIGDGAASCTLGDFSTPQRITELSTPGDDEWAITLTPDEREILYASYQGGTQRIWQATRATANGAFGMPTLETELDSGLGEHDPTLFDQGLSLIVASARADTLGSADFYTYTRPAIGAAFENATHLTALSSGSYDAKTWISSDGLRIYVESTRGSTNRNLWFTQRASEQDPFPTPTQLMELNSTGDDGAPVLSADELDIYIGSTRPNGQGGYDIWHAQRSAIGLPFGPLENVTQLNTVFDDLPNWLAPDGKHFYVMHDTMVSGGRNSDLWVADRACL